MIFTKIIWPIKYNWPAADALGPDYETKIRGLPALAKNIAPDFESTLRIFVEYNDGNEGCMISYRTWPSEEAAQLWIDYTIANFDDVLATIVDKIEIPENSIEGRAHL
jgi:hypothetical protein